MPKVTNHLDLQKKQLKNAAIDNLASAPSSPVEGQMYFNTSLGNKSVFIWDGTQWDKLNDQSSAPTFTQVQTALGTANSAISVNSQNITNVLAPTDGGHAANKSYVDTAVENARQGLNAKQSARLATTPVVGNITLSGAQSIDGVAVATGDRVLVKNQTTASENGIYVVDTTTDWTRATDFDAPSEALGAYVFVREGSTQADTGWLVSSDSIGAIGSASIDFVQFSSAGIITAGSGLSKSGNTLSVDTATIQQKLTASTGITLSGATISVDTSIVARKYATSIGDGSATTFTVTHSLNTEDVTVQVREASGTKEFVLADVAISSATAVTITFDTAPTSNQYRVVVTG